MDSHSSQQALPALLSLPPELAHHVLQYLSKRDRQQFALGCKHASLCALASIRSLVLSHKVLAHCKALKLKTMKYCACVTLRPRAMDELTKLASLLLVHNLHRFPNMTHLRLELLGVYDKQCDVSLILKSVVLHAKQLTGLHIEQDAQVSTKALAYTAELPLLERLSVRTRSGFEPGALGQLSRAVNVTSLQLEVLPPGTNSTTCSTVSNSSGPLSPSAAGQAATTPVKSPSELARLQAADEVGLAKMAGQLQSFSASGFSSASSVRPVTALLAAVAGSPKPHLAELQLGGQEVPGSTINLIASITSLHTLRLMYGCELSSALELSRLSCLGALSQLVVAPVQPPAPVLAAWVKGCKHLTSLAVAGQPGPLPLTPCMPGITALQLLGSAASSTRHSSSTGSSCSVDMASLSITLRSPLSLSGLGSLWPRLTSLEVTGWALDAGSINAILLLEGLTRLQLTGGREPGTARHAGALLPLVAKPGLRQLLLLEVCDIHDAWVSEAVAAAKAACSDGSAPAVRELHLCAPGSGNTTPPNSGNGGEGGGANSIMLTDKGLMQLAAWPRLSSLVVSGMPGITLAGLKALVGGCPSLTQLHVRGCPAVSAAPPESVSKVSVGPGGRAVTLCVS